MKKKNQKNSSQKNINQFQVLKDIKLSVFQNVEIFYIISIV